MCLPYKFAGVVVHTSVGTIAIKNGTRGKLRAGPRPPHTWAPPTEVWRVVELWRWRYGCGMASEPRGLSVARPSACHVACDGVATRLDRSPLPQTQSCPTCSRPDVTRRVAYTTALRVGGESVMRILAFLSILSTNSPYSFSTDGRPSRRGQWQGESQSSPVRCQRQLPSSTARTGRRAEGRPRPIRSDPTAARPSDT